MGGEGGGPRMWIKKIPNVKIINFQKVDKPRGWSDNAGVLIFHFVVKTITGKISFF